MMPTKQKIVEYLNLAPLAHTKSTSDEYLFMMEFLENHALLSRGFNGSLMMNNAGQAYLRNSDLFDEVPLNTLDWKMNIIDQLKNGQKIPEFDGEMARLALNELIQDGVVEQVGKTYFYTLTAKGRRYISSGVGYNDFMNEGHKSDIHIGHKIENIQDAFLDFSNNKTQHTINNNTAQTNPITSLVVWVISIIGLIGSIITIYLFFK